MAINPGCCQECRDNYDKAVVSAREALVVTISLDELFTDEYYSFHYRGRVHECHLCGVGVWPAARLYHLATEHGAFIDG